MVSRTQGQLNCSSDEARASTSQTMSADNQPNIVDLLEVANGNETTNPNEIHGSDEPDSFDKSKSDDSNICMALDKQIARATQTRDRLQKQSQLENINQEIVAPEQEH